MSDDSYIYQLSLVLATAIVSFPDLYFLLGMQRSWVWVVLDWERVRPLRFMFPIVNDINAWNQPWILVYCRIACGTSLFLLSISSFI